MNTFAQMEVGMGGMIWFALLLIPVAFFVLLFAPIQILFYVTRPFSEFFKGTVLMSRASLSTLDLFALVAMISPVLAMLQHIKIYDPFWLVCLLMLMLAIWWSALHALVGKGIENALQRFLFIAVAMPVANVCSFAAPAAAWCVFVSFFDSGTGVMMPLAIALVSTIALFLISAYCRSMHATYGQPAEVNRSSPTADKTRAYES